MENQIREVLFSLLRSAICGDPISNELKDVCSQELLNSVCKLAKKHDMAHLIAYATAKNGIETGDAELCKWLEKKQFQAVYRHEQSEYELSALRETFESEGIAFIPLKGAVIRKYYPEPWMRTSCDIDILVHESELDRAIKALTDQGWKVDGEKNYHDVSLISESGVHLELHFNIREHMENIDGVLDKVWEYSRPVADGRYEYVQSPEFLMFHLIAHMSYHFVEGGCGIRSFADIWLLNGRMSYSENGLAELCREADIDEFYRRVIALTRVWFGDEAHSELTSMAEDYVIFGGVYGNSVNRVAVDQARVGGKNKNLFRKIFMPYDTLKIKYPILEDKKWLLPFYQVKRWIEMLTRGKLKKSLNELNINSNVSEDRVKSTETFLRDMGLGASIKNN